MAPTPYPRNLMHSGSALPLTLKESLAVPPTGDITLVVDGNATSKGWPTIPAGESIVVTVGRGTLYESKYLVSSLTASTDQTSLLVLEVDRAYDGTTPVNAPSGTIVEHTISATEMQQINTHMRSRSQHGADGDLVDTGSAQTLTNKTLTSPAFAGAATSDLPMGGKKVTGLANGSGAQDAATKAQVDSASSAASAAQSTANAALPKAGGTMSGAIAMGGSKVTGLAAATANGDAVRYEQLTPKLDSARVKSGVWSGTTDASGYVTITLPESPTGSWAVIVMEANASLRLVSLIGATSTSAVVRVMYTNGTDLLILASSSVTLHYIAIAVGN